MFNTFRFNANRFNKITVGGLKYMECTMTGVGSVTALANVKFTLICTMTGVGSLISAAVMKFSMVSTMAGVGSLTGVLSVTGDIYEPPYVIEVHNSAGALICILENASVIDYERELNTPHILNFTMPADDDKLVNVILANEIWLRNYRTGVIVRKFILQNTVDSRK